MGLLMFNPAEAPIPWERIGHLLVLFCGDIARRKLTFCAHAGLLWFRSFSRLTRKRHLPYFCCFHQRKAKFHFLQSSSGKGYWLGFFPFMFVCGLVLTRKLRTKHGLCKDTHLQSRKADLVGIAPETQ